MGATGATVAYSYPAPDVTVAVTVMSVVGASTDEAVTVALRAGRDEAVMVAVMSVVGAAADEAAADEAATDEAATDEATTDEAAVDEATELEDELEAGHKGAVLPIFDTIQEEASSV
jgi:hypothetical protein